MHRPHIRWPYSIYQINLKSSIEISLFLILNSGDSLYFSNSIFHSSAFLGGGRPNNFQSTILKPDSVSRVTPPKIKYIKPSNYGQIHNSAITVPKETAPKQPAAMVAIQYPTALGTFSSDASAIVVVHRLMSFLMKLFNF